MLALPKAITFDVTASKAFTRPRDGHLRIMNVNQNPAAIYFAEDLALPPMRSYDRPITAKLGYEVPVELGPRCITTHVNDDIVDAKPALGEWIALSFRRNSFEPPPIRAHALWDG